MNSHSQLHRSADNRMIAGVAAGIAEYSNIDPTIVRLVFLGLAAAGGAGVVLYITGALIMPEGEPKTNTDHAEHKQETIAMTAPNPETTTEEPEDAHRHRHRHENAYPQRNRMLGGLLLIAIGAALLIQQTLGINVWHYFWPLGIIAVGLMIILRRS